MLSIYPVKYCQCGLWVLQILRENWVALSSAVTLAFDPVTPNIWRVIYYIKSTLPRVWRLLISLRTEWKPILSLNGHATQKVWALMYLKNSWSICIIFSSVTVKLSHVTQKTVEITIRSKLNNTIILCILTTLGYMRLLLLSRLQCDRWTESDGWTGQKNSTPS